MWHRNGVLRLAGARVLDDRDRGAVRAILDADPVATCMWDDGWTVLTKDRKRTAQFEHTILVTRGGAEILTLP